jgi:MFS family permease
MGAVSDRVGRRPILIVCTALAVLTAYPAMAWLAAAPSVPRLLAVELWLSALYGGYNGAMVVFLTEFIPPTIRASGFSLAYSLATAVGGFTPFIATWLVKRTGDLAMPGAWLAVCAAAALAAALVIAETAPGRVRA